MNTMVRETNPCDGEQKVRTIKFFDTTLRDGEQTPGVSLNVNEKIEIAKNLESMGINVIEAGFAASSKGDFDAVKGVANAVSNATVASLSRSLKSDIDAAYDALKDAAHPRIHIFIATSDIHMEYKLKMTPEQVYNKAVESVRYAKSLVNDVEFSAEDASRSDVDFLVKIFEGVIEAGASTINIPDTVGYTTPEEYYELISTIKSRVKNINQADISVHCHNDLGLAVSNSLAAVRAGATQIECTVNGLGERGGNAAFEELVMNLDTRADTYNAEHSIDTTKITQISRIVASLTGVNLQVHKPIVGANAFVHASGIHQHGVLANKATYEIMSPEKIGLADHNNIVLGKLSGRHAFEEKLKELNIFLNGDSLNSAFALFKETADRKKNITDMDILAIANEFISVENGRYSLESFQIQSGSNQKSMAMISLKVNGENNIVTEAAAGYGPIDAAFNAVNRAVGNESDIQLAAYNIKAATEGTDALGVVDVRIIRNGKMYKGIGTSTDIIEASVKSYVNAVNNMTADTK